MKKQEVKKYTIQLFYKDSCIRSIVSSNIKDVFNQYFLQLEKYEYVKRTKDLLKIKFTDGKFVQPITNDYKIVCTEYNDIFWTDVFIKTMIDFKDLYGVTSKSTIYEGIKNPENVYSELTKTKKPRELYYTRTKNEKRK